MRMSAWLHQQLPRVWTSKGLLAWLLLPISWVHAAVLRARGLAWHWGWRQAQRLPVPVIVVGNVVAGGAGKTPLTMALVTHLQQRGWRVGVISRGHGRHTHETRAVSPNSLPAEVGDEPLLIRQKTGAPVWVAALRAEAGRGLLKAHPEVNILVCDDGLQHWALARDLEICVMDERGVGNGWLLPAGPLREPWPRPVDLLIHTGENGLSGGFQAQRQLAPIAHDGQGRSLTLSSLIGQPVDAVAGLARPEAFFAMLRATGLQLHHTTAFPDHFDYAHGTPPATDRPLLCTEKDAAKLWQHQPQALAVPLVLTPEAAFWQALDQRLAEKPFH
jgi:tetraacyldisaccharide 4'-kinase